jgi:hypothetical protein
MACKCKTQNAKNAKFCNQCGEPIDNVNSVPQPSFGRKIWKWIWKKRSYKNLYLHILKIGVKNVSDGLSYKMLKKRLEKKRYDFTNTCLEKAVKQWFVNSFVQCDNGDKIDILKLDKDSDENFILNGEASIAYLNYITAKRSKIYCLWAIILATFAILISLKDNLLPFLQKMLCTVFLALC